MIRMMDHHLKQRKKVNIKQKKVAKYDLYAKIANRNTFLELSTEIRDK